MSKLIKRILVTGGTGFIGHHAVEHVFKNRPDWEVVILHGPGSAGHLGRINDIEIFPVQVSRGKARVVFHDIRAPLVNEQLLAQIGKVDYILHFAAESHVDNSISNPEIFVQTNVVGTCNMLEFARRQPRLKSYIQISTDEVYGPAAIDEHFKETDRTKPSNPYSATKVGADALVQAYARTYNFPGFIVRTMNNIGERQHPEKFIPKTIRGLIQGKGVIIHGNKNAVASRSWIHPRNFSDALLFLLDIGEKGGIYHVAGEEYDCLELAGAVAKIMGVNFKYRLVDFHKMRPGHDLRYALDSSKIHDLGWHEPLGFNQMLNKCVSWMMLPANQHWLGL